MSFSPDMDTNDTVFSIVSLYFPNAVVVGMYNKTRDLCNINILSFSTRDQKAKVSLTG